VTYPDPLAEVARLRDPAGPWLHLLWGAPADARQFGWLLAGEELASRVLRGPSVRTTYGLFDEAAAALQFPGDLVPDWPAFGALLRDLSWLPGPAGQVLLVTRASLLLAAAPAAELVSFVTAVVTVAAERAGRREPALHVVLADDAVGLAVLRARLQAMPAGVRDVVGWRPEEPAVALGAGGRAEFSLGSLTLDAVDDAVVTVLAPLGPVQIRRGFEEYHGPPSDPVRTYGVVLARDEAAVSAVAVAGAVGRALAGTGAAGVMLPIAAEPAERGEREAAFVANSAQLWPAEFPVAGVRGPAAERAGEQPPEPIPTPVQPAPAEPAPAEAAPALPGGLPHVQHPEILDVAERADSELWTDESTVDNAVEQAATSDMASEDLPAEEPAGGGEDGSSDDAAGPADSPDVPFTLVAADLEWEFAKGSADPDAADAALVAAAGETGQFTAMFRTWTRDPGAGWVRVLVGYAVTDADAARATLISAAQAGGARRTCVEVVAEAEVSDVHRWLERQCVRLWPTAAPTDGPTDRPTDRPPAAQSAEPPAPGESPQPAGAAPDPTPSPVSAETALRPGPAEPDAAGQRLVTWAAEQPGVLGIVSAWTGGPDTESLTYGIVVDAEADLEQVRADAGQVLDDPAAAVEAFSPARGLAPAQLKLYRGSTRLWAKTADRPVRTSGAADTGPKIDLTFHDLTSSVSAEDETIDGLTLYALTLLEEISEEPPPEEPDACDQAVTEWAKVHPNLLAVARGTVAAYGQDLRVYLLVADPDVDTAETRRAAAAIMAAQGLTAGGVEMFCPLDPIPRFYLDLYRLGAQLWRSDRKLTPRAETEQSPEQTPDSTEQSTAAD
jgi:hypothetical protein